MLTEGYRRIQKIYRNHLPSFTLAAISSTPGFDDEIMLLPQHTLSLNWNTQGLRRVYQKSSLEERNRPVLMRRKKIGAVLPCTSLSGAQLETEIQ